MGAYTAEQIAEWMAVETRMMPLPDGNVRPLMTFNLVWSKFDSLITLDGYSAEELIGYAVEEAGLQNITFEQAFVAVVGWLDNQRRDRWGVA
ncbi:MAG: hypothetical protein L6Q57_06830 [Alphaproteobacteria bacterium]|nr:hypothetical protein [Alphaproteobacteria bacterium]